MGEPDEKALEGPLKEVAQFLAVLDANLSGKDWVAGELSIADFAVASTFVYRKAVRTYPLKAAPHVSAWIDRLEARPSWQAATRPMLESWATELRCAASGGQDIGAAGHCLDGCATSGSRSLPRPLS